MKRFLIFALLVVTLIFSSGSSAHAQFLKKLFGKEEPKRKPVARPKPTAGTKKPGTKSKRSGPEDLSYPDSYKKDRYRIDVLLPLYLGELVKGEKAIFKDKLPGKVLPGINFYEGIKLAVDSVDKQGYKIDVYVHDITDIGQSPAQLIAAKKLDSSDLIIGAVNAAQIAPIAAFAKKNNINFVSAMSPSDGSVKDNLFFTILQPTLQTNCEWLQKTIEKKHGSERVLMYHRSTVAVDELAFKSMVKDSVLKTIQINANVLPKKDQLQPFLDSTETNIIVIPIIDVVYAEQLLDQLKDFFPQYKFEIYGMPSWKGMKSIQKSSGLENITVSFTAPFFFDASTASGQSLATNYQKAFGRKPGEMVYRGYETIYWYCYLLNKYGPVFNKKISDNASAVYTRFEIKPRFNKDFDLLYNENTHLYLYRYQNGSFEVEQ